MVGSIYSACGGSLPRSLIHRRRCQPHAWHNCGRRLGAVALPPLPLGRYLVGLSASSPPLARGRAQMKRGRGPARASRAHRPHQPSGGGVGLADAFESIRNTKSPSLPALPSLPYPPLRPFSLLFSPAQLQHPISCKPGQRPCTPGLKDERRHLARSRANWSRSHHNLILAIMPRRIV